MATTRRSGAASATSAAKPKPSASGARSPRKAAPKDLGTFRAKHTDAETLAVADELEEARRRLALVRRVLASLEHDIDGFDTGYDSRATFEALMEFGEALGKKRFRMPLDVADMLANADEAHADHAGGDATDDDDDG